MKNLIVVGVLLFTGMIKAQSVDVQELGRSIGQVLKIYGVTCGHDEQPQSLEISKKIANEFSKNEQLKSSYSTLILKECSSISRDPSKYSTECVSNLEILLGEKIRDYLNQNQNLDPNCHLSERWMLNLAKFKCEKFSRDIEEAKRYNKDVSLIKKNKTCTYVVSNCKGPSSLGDAKKIESHKFMCKARELENNEHVCDMKTFDECQIVEKNSFTNNPARTFKSPPTSAPAQ